MPRVHTLHSITGELAFQSNINILFPLNRYPAPVLLLDEATSGEFILLRVINYVLKMIRYVLKMMDLY